LEVEWKSIFLEERQSGRSPWAGDSSQGTSGLAKPRKAIRITFHIPFFGPVLSLLWLVHWA
jgi:hypothetical protein